MYISEICIKRPVLATVLNLVIILTGLVAFFKLQVRDSPDVSFPIITIEASLNGANSEFMEKNVTKIIEQAIKNVKNIEHIESESRNQSTEITVFFDMKADLEIALSDIRSKISEVSNLLPKDMKLPQVLKMDKNSWNSMGITVTGEKYDTMTLTDIVTQRVKPEIEKLSSVAKAEVYSNATFAIQISLDPTKLFQNKLTPQEIGLAIKAQSQDYPAGNIKTESRDFIISLNGSLNTAEEYSNIIISSKDGNILKLKDLATVEVKPIEFDNAMRYNGQDTVFVGITKQSKANVIELSGEVLKLLPKLKKILPEGIKLNIAFDMSVPVKAGINSVYLTAFEALILVMIIVYLFLGSLRATIVPFVAIPVSIIGTFAIMQLLGFTINMYSLLAMIMAIGLVVDDAIVMLENIYRHYEEGATPTEAAFKASKEISFAIIAMTITLAAVFLPIGFLEGYIGKLFVEFAWTLASCVIISGFVAITLSPMLTAKILSGKKESSPPKLVQDFDSKLKILSEFYAAKLSWALSNLKKISYISLCSVLVLFVGFYFVNKEFMPQEDSSFIMISGSGADGATLSSTVESIKEAENIVKNFKEVKGYFFQTYNNSVNSFIPLKDWSERNKSQQELVSLFNPKLTKITGITFYAFSPNFSGGGEFGKPVSVSIQSFGSFEDLDKISQSYFKEVKANKIFQNVDRDLKTSVPTIEIDVNRDIAAKHGVLLDQIGITMQYLIAGIPVGQFSIGNESYPIFMGFDKEDKNKLSDLSKIYVKSQNGEMVHLSNLANIKETISVLAYKHYNTARSVQISASLADGYTISDAKVELDKISEKLIDKSKFNVEYLGGIKQMSESNSGMIFTFVLALMFIYLVLAAQFESFVDPAIILVSVPFSITGGVLALLIFGSSLNLYSNIGMVTLIGLITKNSIMIVEFANQLKAAGSSTLDAITSSCKLRLRPILMTSFATIFGCLPLVFASGAAAGSRSSIGLVIVGGMLVGTFFTLFVIPSIYFRVKR